MSRPLWLLAAPVIFLILWSAGFSVAKIGLHHVPPMTLLALRYLLAVALLLPAALVLRPPLPRSRRAFFDVAVTGFLIQVVYFGLCYLSFRAGTPAGTVAIIVCLQPILVALIAPGWVGERIGATRWLGLGLGLLGAGAVIWSRQGVGAASAFGLLTAGGGLLGITGGTLYEKRYGVSQHPLTANLIQYGVGALFTLPLALLMERFQVDWGWELTWVMAYLVIGNSLIAITLLLALIRVGEVSRVSSLFYLVPPLAALFAWPMLGEVMAPMGWAGMAVAAAGVALVARPVRRDAPKGAR